MLNANRLLLLSVGLTLTAVQAIAQSDARAPTSEGRRLSGMTPSSETARAQLPEPQVAGMIRGKVIDGSGGVLEGAHVKLSHGTDTQSQDELSDADGEFSFASVAAGPFQLTMSSEGFATQTYFGALHSGEIFSAPAIVMVVAMASTEVHVSLSRAEEAKAEIKDEEKQRVLGVVPNFYVTYNHDNGRSHKLRINRSHRGNSAGDRSVWWIWRGRAGLRQAVWRFLR
jgi:hypothetical protein